ncbi:MAG: DUF4382 domain-containing protein [bacterium]|nr:DUF4382 domain-containing protein [bacterium]
MPSKSIIIAILVVVVLGAALFFLPANKGATPPAQAPVASAQGKVVLGISDAATALTGVTSIMMTVNKVEVQNATQEWVTVSSGTKQYDLLVLKQSGAIALLADINLPIGTYNQIRLTISKVEVTANGKIQEAKLPSNTLKIVGRLVVEEGETATAVLDFKADKSLHATGNGKFILAPVVNLQTKSNASVEITSNNVLKIGGGKTEDDVNVGMDERGEIKNNFELDIDAKIEIDSNNIIQIVGQGKVDAKNEGEVKLNLSSQNNSGIAGTATLDSEDGKVKVTLKLNEVSTGIVGRLGISVGATHPAHIHLGSCASIGAVKYPLNSTVDGKSETTINVSLASLKAQMPLAINAHKSPDEPGVYVACADLKLK